MTTISFVSNVTPNIVPPTKKNNLIKKDDARLASQIKYVILLESLFGFNRVYLLEPRKITEVVSYVYSVTFLLFLVYFYISSFDEISSFMKMIKYGFLSAYLVRIYCLHSIAFGRRQFIKFFKTMETIDEMLNIVNTFDVTSSIGETLFIVMSISTNILQYYLLSVNYNKAMFASDLALAYLPTVILNIVSDMEQLFYTYALKFVYMRLVVLRAHVEKLNAVTNDTDIKKSTLEKVAEKPYFGIEYLREVYEKLHECGEIINLIISIPMLLTFVTSGVNTIMLLKEAVIMTQADTTPCLRYGIMYIAVRCVKSTLLLVVPCYFSSLTVSQAVKLKTALHDALLTAATDESERHTLKYFHRMTKECSFEYCICGVINLNMAVPFSYFNLCTTYLIIVIQFSKLFE